MRVSSCERPLTRLRRRARRLAVGAAVALAAAGCGADTATTSVTSPRARAGAARPTAATNATTGLQAATTTTAGGEAATTTAAGGPSDAPRRRKPAIVRMFIPFPRTRKREMAAYSKRHYGVSEYRLLDPRVIVEHYTVSDSVEATFNTFAPDVADVELHELPGVCSHFVIGKDGTIYQLVPLSLRCRHTVGLNDRAFGIEHVGNSDAEILGRPRQLRASLRLTAWLRCRYGIAVEDVIGHNESLTSPYHHENVARLKSQTHADWTKRDMDVYRRKLRARGGCG